MRDKISDELREYCKDLYKGGPNYMTLTAIADRIDAEMVERPLAADGKPVVDGETLYDSDGREYHVNKLSQLVDVSTDTYSGTRRPETLTHTRPDSLERIAGELDEMVRGGHTVESFAQDWERLHELCQRIRKQMKELEHE